MGRRRDHKVKAIVREFRDDEGRMIRHVTIGSASEYFSNKTKDRKMDPSWEQQTVPKQRGRKPNRDSSYSDWLYKHMS